MMILAFTKDDVLTVFNIGKTSNEKSAVSEKKQRDQRASGCLQAGLGLLGILGACYVIWQILIGNL